MFFLLLVLIFFFFRLFSCVCVVLFSKKMLTFSDAAGDYLDQTYGSIMKQEKMGQLKHSVAKYTSSHNRVKWFSIMIGWGYSWPEKEDTNNGNGKTDQPQIHTPFHALSVDVCLCLLSNVFSIDAIEEQLDNEPCLVTIKNVLKALHDDRAFDQDYRLTDQFHALVSSIKSKTKQRSGKVDDMVLEFDDCLDVVMHAWYAWKASQKNNGVQGNMDGVRTSQNSDDSVSADNRVEVEVL